MKPNLHEPKQQRSRETLRALLTATVRLLDKDGLENCTLPRIADEAGVSAASVYRRFSDKDALVKAAFLKVLEQSNATNQVQLEKQLLRDGLKETAGAIVAALLHQYLEHPRLMRALVIFLEANARSGFAREANRRIAQNLKLVAAVLLRHTKQIRHRDPRRAATFAVLQTASSIEAAVLGRDSLWSIALPLNDRKFAEELTRGMVAYLRHKS
jgi:AcrR family transcriptional regulator